MNEIILPELIAELDDALILVLSDISEHLSILYERIYRGEKVDYLFQWDLIKMEDHKYIVGLVVSWGGGEETVTIGFTKELWEFLSIIRENGQLVLMTDWGMAEKGADIINGDDQGLLTPKALIIKDAYSGMETLSKQVVNEALVNEPKKELYELLDILKPSSASSYLN